MQSTAAPDARPWTLFAKGFRPFFLLSAIAAVALVPAWTLALAGVLPLGPYLIPMYWHAHEMVFGFAVGVIAGFLLTAAGNWTQRETATGPLLGGLCVLWALGRVALLASPPLPGLVVAVVNLAFLPALGVVVGRVIVAAKSRRNYGFLALLAGLWLAQLGVHLGALGIAPAWQRTGSVVGVDLIVLIILVVAGRIIPLFTRNATKAEGIENVPLLDQATFAGMAILTGLDAFAAPALPIAIVAAATALLAALRARRWGARHAWGTPMLWVLHLGYAFIPAGLALRAVAALDGLSSSAALHALTTGAIGTLTLGMMARVTLGHTGRVITAGPALAVAFGMMIAAALVRVAGGAAGEPWFIPSLHASATLWALAFLIYLVKLGGVLFAPRPDGKPG